MNINKLLLTLILFFLLSVGALAFELEGSGSHKDSLTSKELAYNELTEDVIKYAKKNAKKNSFDVDLDNFELRASEDILGAKITKKNKLFSNKIKTTVKIDEDEMITYERVLSSLKEKIEADSQSIKKIKNTTLKESQLQELQKDYDTFQKYQVIAIALGSKKDFSLEVSSTDIGDQLVGVQKRKTEYRRIYITFESNIPEQWQGYFNLKAANFITDYKDVANIVITNVPDEKVTSTLEVQVIADDLEEVMPKHYNGKEYYPGGYIVRLNNSFFLKDIEDDFYIAQDTVYSEAEERTRTKSYQDAIDRLFEKLAESFNVAFKGL